MTTKKQTKKQSTVKVEQKVEQKNVNLTINFNQDGFNFKRNFKDLPTDKVTLKKAVGVAVWQLWQFAQMQSNGTIKKAVKLNKPINLNISVNDTVIFDSNRADALFTQKFKLNRTRKSAKALKERILDVSKILTTSFDDMDV